MKVLISIILCAAYPLHLVENALWGAGFFQTEESPRTYDEYVRSIYGRMYGGLILLLTSALYRGFDTGQQIQRELDANFPVRILMEKGGEA